jgi:pyridoxal phosphate phosphatase PHOSPHO2
MDSEKSDKILLIFDLDYTILSGSSFTIPMKSLMDETILSHFLLKLKTSENWADLQQELFSKMKELNIDLNKFKSIVQDISLNSGFKELFDFIRLNKPLIETIIVSGGNTLTIKWTIEKHNLHDIIHSYYSNPAEEHTEDFIRITQNHQHDCTDCNKCQCKRIILQEFLKMKQYRRICYVGDGTNDYCPGKILSENDILFARENFGLHKMTQTNPLNCLVVPWVDGFIIVEEIQKVLNSFVPKF